MSESQYTDNNKDNNPAHHDEMLQFGMCLHHIDIILSSRNL